MAARYGWVVRHEGEAMIRKIPKLPAGQATWRRDRRSTESCGLYAALADHAGSRLLKEDR